MQPRTLLTIEDAIGIKRPSASDLPATCLGMCAPINCPGKLYWVRRCPSHGGVPIRLHQVRICPRDDLDHVPMPSCYGGFDLQPVLSLEEIP